MWTLRRTLEVDGAHRLPLHAGKCANLHGHRWRVTVEVAADHLDASGMVVDFGVISEIVRQFDHVCLNDLPAFATPNTQPTAERIAAHLYHALDDALEATRGAVVAVEVEESPGAVVRYEEPPT